MTYATSAPNPANGCQTCEPAQNPTDWTTSGNGTTCGTGTGEYCYGGVCTAGCEVAGTFYPMGAADPTNACQVCTPASSATSFSAAKSGTICGAHEVCNLGVCATGCFIQGTFWANQATNPANTCEVCDASASTQGWSNAPNLTACQGNAYCIAGACEQGCQINGTTYAPGASNPTSPCEVCAPRQNPGSWTSPCSSCSPAMGTCTIDCTGPGTCGQGEQLTCPAGLSCTVECSTAQSCENLTISASGPLDVRCSGAQACLNTTMECLGAGACTVECSGMQSCQGSMAGAQEQGLVCGTGACTATCTNQSSLNLDCGESSTCTNNGCAVP